MSFCTPSELFVKYPQLATVWTKQDIGYLVRMKLVRGKKLPRTCLVDPTQVLHLFENHTRENIQ